MELHDEGIYIIRAFGSVDQELFERPSRLQSLVGARTEGDELVATGICRWFTVYRVLHNSNPDSANERWLKR